MTRELLNEPWRKVASRRRFFLLILVLAPSVTAAGVMASLLPHRGSTWLEMAIIFTFCPVRWISWVLDRSGPDSGRF